MLSAWFSGHYTPPVGPLDPPGLICRLPTCTTEIPTHAGRGRPKTYCSDECRNQAQHDRDQLNRAINYLEAVRDSYGYDPGKDTAPITWHLSPSTVVNLAQTRRQLTEIIDEYADDEDDPLIVQTRELLRQLDDGLGPGLQRSAEPR